MPPTSFWPLELVSLGLGCVDGATDCSSTEPVFTLARPSNAGSPSGATPATLGPRNSVPSGGGNWSECRIRQVCLERLLKTTHCQSVGLVRAFDGSPGLTRRNLEVCILTLVLRVKVASLRHPPCNCIKRRRGHLICKLTPDTVARESQTSRRKGNRASVLIGCFQESHNHL